MDPTKVSIDLFNSEQPCRLEKCYYKENVVYSDVCHNEQGLRATLNLLAKSEKSVTIICAFSKSKDLSSMLKILADPET